MMAFVVNLIVILLTFNNAEFDTLSADFDLCMYAEGSEKLECVSGKLIVDREKDNEKVFFQMSIERPDQDGTVIEESIAYIWRFDENMTYVIENKEKTYASNILDISYAELLSDMLNQFLAEYRIENKIKLTGTDETIIVRDNTQGDGSYILIITDPEYGNIARVVELRAQKPSLSILGCYLTHVVIDKPLDAAVFEVPEGYSED
jgi:hypothetical protein